MSHLGRMIWAFAGVFGYAGLLTLLLGLATFTYGAVRHLGASNLSPTASMPAEIWTDATATLGKRMFLAGIVLSICGFTLRLVLQMPG